MEEGEGEFIILIFKNMIGKTFGIYKMDFLISVYIFCIAVSELMGAKTFPLVHYGSFQLNASVAIFVIPVLFSINDIITEVYGPERTRSVIRSGLLVILFILILSVFFTNLPPSMRFEKMEAAYDTIFGLSARIAAASLIAFTIAEFLDVSVFMKIRKRLGKKALWLRNNLSNFVAQFFDTVIFMTLAFYAFDKSAGDNLSFLTSLILPYWLVKCGMSIIETPLVYVGVKWLMPGGKKS